MSDHFDVERFKRDRRSLKRWSVVCIVGGLIWTLVDCMTPFPTPARGPFALAIGLPIVLAGFWLSYLAERLPVKEAVQLAASPQYQGLLKVTDLVQEMGVTLSTAERTLYALEKRGYAQSERDEQDGTEVFRVDVRVVGTRR